MMVTDDTTHPAQGTLRYGRPPEVIELDDRTLAHVAVVMLAKLRRSEPFAFSYPTVPGGLELSTIWIHPAIPLQIVFARSRPTEINRAWIEVLANSANSVEGMHLIAEPS